MPKMQAWPLGITIFIVLFVIVTVVSGIIISREHVNMVTDNYYEKDLRYQDRYETLARTKALAAPPVIRWDAASGACVVNFADSMAAAGVTGDVRFYRSSDSRADRTMTLDLDAAGDQVFTSLALARGAWIVQLSWVSSGLPYYMEERIYVP